MQGSMRIFLVLLGLIAGGRIWICYLPYLMGGGERCRMYCSVPGPLQSVQRAEIWEILIALQGQTALHVGVDNLNVVNHLSSLIASRWSGRPFPLVNDGDLLGLAQEIVRSRGRGNTLVSKVKGHADEGLVAMGRVREVDRIGNNEADAAADMGRRRVHDSITDARRLFNAACAHWYPIVKELQHFFVAIARTVVNYDGSGVLPCILLCGLVPLIPRGGGFIGRFGIWPGYLVQSLFGPRSGGLPKGLRFLRMISVHGLFRSGCWLKSLIFLLLCDGRRVLMI